MTVTFQIDLGKLNGTLAQAKRAGLANAGQHTRNTIVSQFGMRSGGTPSSPGSPPNRQRGGLSRSISTQMRSDSEVRVGTNLVYAMIHEKGGVIRPVKARYLWMPVSAKTKDTPAAVIADKKNIAFIPRRSGGYYVVRKSKSGRKTKGGLLYILLNAVWMPRRPFMAPGFEKSKPGIMEAFRLGSQKYFGLGGA